MHRDKVFCIGYGKTGTTSLEKALVDLGYTLGHQQTAELLIHDWARRDFTKIIEFCKSAEAFQDVPFCLPYTYIALDLSFPESKFILSVRDNSEQWYNSLIRFHSKKYADGIREPNAEDFMRSEYRYKGYSWEARQLAYGVTVENPNDKVKLIHSYETHNANVQEYFRFRKRDLLVLNVAEPKSYKKLCEFLGKAPVYERFPWENKTSL